MNPSQRWRKKDRGMFLCSYYWASITTPALTPAYPSLWPGCWTCRGLSGSSGTGFPSASLSGYKRSTTPPVCHLQPPAHTHTRTHTQNQCKIIHTKNGSWNLKKTLVIIITFSFTVMIMNVTKAFSKYVMKNHLVILLFMWPLARLLMMMLG